MEEKSRVTLYAELRKQISAMDSYSFADTKKDTTPEEEKKLAENIDKMLSDKQSYQAREEEKSRRAKYVSRHQKPKGLSQGQIVALLVLAIALIVSLFVVLFATGVL